MNILWLWHVSKAYPLPQRKLRKCQMRSRARRMQQEKRRFLQRLSQHSLKWQLPESSERDRAFKTLRNDLVQAICGVFRISSQELGVKHDNV